MDASKLQLAGRPLTQAISDVANKLLGVRSFPESEVLDWTIVHPDGHDEGNYVGKFMEMYKPR